MRLKSSSPASMIGKKKPKLHETPLTKCSGMATATHLWTARWKILRLTTTWLTRGLTPNSTRESKKFQKTREMSTWPRARVAMAVTPQIRCCRQPRKVKRRRRSPSRLQLSSCSPLTVRRIWQEHTEVQHAVPYVVLASSTKKTGSKTAKSSA